MIDILIPTMDNRQYLEPCINSILLRTKKTPFHIFVINNGLLGSCDWLDNPKVEVLEAGGNHGWTGALAYGLGNSNAEHVMFLNDDTLILPAYDDWLRLMVKDFGLDHVGAVGPSTNCAIGCQSIFSQQDSILIEAPFLVGFCLLLSRKALDDAGGVDPSLPGGDDIDLSIRLRQKNYILLADKSVFVYHHGFVTGNRVYGPSHLPTGWNSRHYAETIQLALLEKHGPEGMKMIGWG